MSKTPEEKAALYAYHHTRFGDKPDWLVATWMNGHGEGYATGYQAGLAARRVDLLKLRKCLEDAEELMVNLISGPTSQHLVNCWHDELMKAEETIDWQDPAAPKEEK
jgi:hypothetical protein